ncbi:MAG: methyltransferase [Xanthobacteraceae bacterium]
MTPELAAAVDALRLYLDRVGFQQICKFIVGVNQYMVAPSMISAASAGKVEHFFDTVLYDCRELALLQCLMTGRSAARRTLSECERRLADLLIAADILREADRGANVTAADRQLITAFNLDLLIDRRIHFGGKVHEVYIGPDSYWMLYYIDTAAIGRDHRMLDLCTGSGIAALYLSLFSDRVVATDIGDAPLALTAINRRLNGREAMVEIRSQELSQTLDGGERFNLLTCNPPFVAYPPGIQGTLYSHGIDADGLGYLRSIIRCLPAVLTPGGCAYLVADLVGDKRRPHFAEELEHFAASDGLGIDVYIDNVLPASAQIAPLANYLARINSGRSSAQIASELVAFQRETLRAERYYMSTIRLRTAAPKPGLRVLRRCPPPRAVSEETWPELLLRN